MFWATWALPILLEAAPNQVTMDKMSPCFTEPCEVTHLEGDALRKAGWEAGLATTSEWSSFFSSSILVSFLGKKWPGRHAQGYKCTWDKVGGLLSLQNGMDEKVWCWWRGWNESEWAAQWKGWDSPWRTLTLFINSLLGMQVGKAVGSKEPFCSQHRLYSVLTGCVSSQSPQTQVRVPFLGVLGEEGHLCTFSCVPDTSVGVTSATSCSTWFQMLNASSCDLFVMKELLHMHFFVSFEDFAMPLLPHKPHLQATQTYPSGHTRLTFRTHTRPSVATSEILLIPCACP